MKTFRERQRAIQQQRAVVERLWAQLRSLEFTVLQRTRLRETRRAHLAAHAKLVALEDEHAGLQRSPRSPTATTSSRNHSR